MALETATYISQLVATNPLTTDPLAQAGDHINLTKAVLQNQFTNLGTVAVTATATSINAAASAFANGTITAIQPNGTVASAELDLLGLINSGGTTVAGRVRLINTAASAAAGGLAIKMSSSADVNSTITALGLTLDGTLTAAAALDAPAVRQSGHALVPSGMIMLWSGSVASIPSGWVICDGTNSTPDLRNSFIVGAGDTYSPSATGGSSGATYTSSTAGAHTHTDGSAGAHDHGSATAGYALQVADMPAHNHSVGLTDPGHQHGVPGAFYIQTGPNVLAAGSSAQLNATALTAAVTTGISVSETTVGSGTAHSHGISSDGAHQHSISTDGNHSHTVAVAATLPPYFALCYVMKT